MVYNAATLVLPGMFLFTQIRCQFKQVMKTQVHKRLTFCLDVNSRQHTLDLLFPSRLAVRFMAPRSPDKD